MSSRIRIVVLGLALCRGSAPAQVVTEFPIADGTAPVGITAGPDSSLWFTLQAANRIGRITPLGVKTEFSAGISPSANLQTITAGPDGNLWFTEGAANRIGRITPLGVVTEFSAAITAGSVPFGITAGPDGNLWFTEVAGNRIGRITPLGAVTEFSAGITPASWPSHIAAGADGNLWFTEQAVSQIGRITPLGAVTEFSTGIAPFAQPLGIAAGPDGNLWFTEIGGNRIARITPSGVVMEFGAGITPGAQPIGIAAGPDGNLWFTELSTDKVGRITPLGVVTEFPALTAGPGVAELTAVAPGPDGNVWFTAISYNGITGDGLGRITTGPDTAASFYPTTPCRVLDTRDTPSALGGPALAAGATRDVIVTGTCGIPSAAIALSANVTITQPTSSGTLFTLPAGFGVLAFPPGVTRANNALLRLARDGSGTLSLSNDMPSGFVHVLVDVNGWWQ